MNKIFRFFNPYKAAKKQTIIFLFYSSCRALYNVFFVLVIGYVTTTIETGDKSGLMFWLMLIITLIVIHFTLKITVKPRLVVFEMKIREYLDAKYLKKFLVMNNNYAESIGTGRLISIIQKGINTWVELSEEVLWGKMIMIITVIFSLGYIVLYYPVIFLRTILFIVLSIFRITPFANRALIRRKKRKDAGTAMDRTLVRRLMSKFEMLQSNSYLKEIQTRKSDYYEVSNYFYREKIQQAWGYDIIVVLSELIYIVGIIYVLGVGAIEGIYTISDFVVISGLGLTIHGNIFNLQMEARRTIDQLIHIEKLRDLFDNALTIEGYDTGSNFKYQTGAIAISNLTYGYAVETPIFKNFNLTIQGGKKTALVGMSGSGKSTLVKLIAGYLRPNSGSIFVDGQDLKEVSLKSYYPHIGYLTQEPSVFDGTIRENLLYAVETESPLAPLGERGESIDEYSPSFPKRGLGGDLQNRIEEAIRLSKCEFIYEFPDGLDTEIGERGVRLSGGQRQRLAIAKIFLKDPKIIILDEPTSALDSFSEEAITEAMHKLFENRTVIIIAHRLQTVKEADEIILLGVDKPTGRDEISFVHDHQVGSQIIERGTHEELVNQGGQYARMLEVQTGF